MRTLSRSALAVSISVYEANIPTDIMQTHKILYYLRPGKHLTIQKLGSGRVDPCKRDQLEECAAQSQWTVVASAFVQATEQVLNVIGQRIYVTEHTLMVFRD